MLSGSACVTSRSRHHDVGLGLPHSESNVPSASTIRPTVWPGCRPTRRPRTHWRQHASVYASSAEVGAVDDGEGQFQATVITRTPWNEEVPDDDPIDLRSMNYEGTAEPAWTPRAENGPIT